MKIVVLDGHAINPGDLDWNDLRTLGECSIHPRSVPQEILPRMAGATIAITNKVPFDAAVISALPDLRYIGVTATGFNIIDTAAARAQGIVVTNVPVYGTASVAQLAFALILELTHNVGRHAQVVRNGKWSASADFCFWETPLVELEGLTLGIVGFGAIGRTMARIAQAFGMKILVHTQPPIPLPAPCEAVNLNELFRRSDIVTLHCPLTPETRGLVNAERLALMKPTAFVVNTSRGQIVEEDALAAALNEGRIAGAAVDVLSTEPPQPANPLLTARNCIITPHIAWATKAARLRLMRTVVDNLRAFLAGKPQNVVG